MGVALLGAALASCAAPETPTPSMTGEADAVSDYQDGSYDATGWYGSLPSHHDVTLTLRDDAVTEVQITTPADDPVSLEYQQRFAAALPGEIIGRDIDTLQIDRLAGASGCSEGFMDALAKIKNAAQS
ncbi:hypothetical protein GCM10010460_13640 [Microbacterium terrae]|nr:hypothetical protein GCM10017594_15600 [Microbacterium terrae]